MISLDCKLKKYITIFSLLLLSQSCFALTKKVFTSTKVYKSGLEKHWQRVNDDAFLGNKVSYEFYKITSPEIPAISDFTNCYYIKGGKFYYLPDLCFAKLENYSFLGDIYIPDADNGQWVDEVLYAAEEERIASEIADMDNTNEDYQYEAFDSEQRAQEIEAAIDGSIQEKYFYDKNYSLSHMSFENEIFMFQKRDDGFIGIHTNENVVQRIFYDLQYRTQRKETWNRDATVNQINNIYEYEENNVKPSKKIIEELTVTPGKKEVIFYDEEGLVSESNVYAVVKDKIDDTEISREEIKSKSTWKYDSQNRVIKSIQKIYSYSDDTYSKQTDVFEKKYIYLYHEPQEDEEGNSVEIPADTEYYEENILRMRFVYKSKLNYTKQYFFDDDFNVTSYYVDDKLTKEVYRTGKKVIRIKSYDN